MIANARHTPLGSTATTYYASSIYGKRIECGATASL
jgi:hypothetical protein